MSFITIAHKKKNFTNMEKKVLMHIVKRYPIVLNKQTDSATSSEKNNAWVKIAKEFNASRHVSQMATNQQLRRLHQNLKQRMKAQPDIIDEKDMPFFELPSSDPLPETPLGTITETFHLTGAPSTTPPVIILNPESPAMSQESIEDNRCEINQHFTDDLRRGWSEELYKLEVTLMKEKIREARAKADLAELHLHRQQGSFKVVIKEEPDEL